MDGNKCQQKFVTAPLLKLPAGFGESCRACRLQAQLTFLSTYVLKLEVVDALHVGWYRAVMKHYSGTATGYKPRLGIYGACECFRRPSGRNL